MTDRLDVVVFGATGFTGALASEYLAAHAPPGTRWAIAGRDRGKLAALRSRLTGPCPPAELVIADIGEPGSMRSMAERARVVLTTVGPYRTRGEPALRAAVEGGAHYVDITGEPAFVQMSLEKYDGPARERGVRVVSCCGFESIVPDLGAQFTAGLLPSDQPMRIDALVRSRGTFSGGTWQSALHAFSTERLARPRQRPPSTGRRARLDMGRIRRIPELGCWAVPLPMIDPQIVLRSARTLDLYGPDFVYGHYARVRRLPTVVAGLGAVAAVVLLSRLGPTRRLLQDLRKEGEGPSAEERARSWFEMTFLGEGGGKRVTTSVSGGDPGYTETAKMVAESALCLAQDRLLPPRAGVLTPAVAMGETLRARLVRAGIRFQVVER